MLTSSFDTLFYTHQIPNPQWKCFFWSLCSWFCRHPPFSVTSTYASSLYFPSKSRGIKIAITPNPHYILSFPLTLPLRNPHKYFLVSYTLLVHNSKTKFSILSYDSLHHPYCWLFFQYLSLFFPLSCGNSASVSVHIPQSSNIDIIYSISSSSSCVIISMK